jgi:hypothetical protein
VFVVVSALTTGYRGKSVSVFIPKLKFDLLAMAMSGGLTLTVYYFHGDLFGVALR